MMITFSSVTSRSRDDVVHTSRIHKTRPYSNHRLHINSHHERTQERTFEGRTRCFVRTVLTAVVTDIRGLNLRVGRWKWGTSNVTGKVDEVVHDGQAQVQSNKVRVLVCVQVRDYANTAGRVCLLGQHYYTLRPRGRPCRKDCS
jgi:hypothetical protein